MTLVEILEKFWPLIASFLTLGGGWYWKNKKTKTSKRLENLESDSRELANLKLMIDLVQTNIKAELIEKNVTIDKLTTTINKLNEKVDNLTKIVRSLQNQVQEDDKLVIDIAKKCMHTNNKDCEVFKYLKNKTNVK